MGKELIQTTDCHRLLSDTEISEILKKDIDANLNKANEEFDVCAWCGTVIIKNTSKKCPSCGHDIWANSNSKPLHRISGFSKRHRLCFKRYK